MKASLRFTKIIAVLCGAVILASAFFISSARAVEAEPIVFVPGILGSWHWLVLMDESDDPIIDTNGWSFPPGFQSYDNVMAAFKNAASEDKVFVAFYDWRRPNRDSAKNYLKPVINKAKAVSPTGKVDIVAHSMGGLVARAYIQGSDYEDDVDQLVTLGTPHFGASDAYLSWEGGDLSFYERILRVILRAYLFYHNPEGVGFQHLVLRKTAPSVKELLPTYDYLKDADGNIIPTNALQEQNPLLPELNNSAQLRTLYERARVMTVAGDGEQTLSSISVVAPTDFEKALVLWPDGKPNPLPPPKDSTEGDNRVLKASAWLPDIEEGPPPPVFLRAPTWRERLLAFIFPKAQAQFFGPPFTQPVRLALNSCHTCLPSAAIDEVLQTLGLVKVGDFPPFVEPDSYLAFYFASPVKVSVTDPQGRTISKNSNTIPGAAYSDDGTSNGPRLVLIPNPVDGEYKIELTGTGEGEFHLGAQYFGATSTEPAVTTGAITTDETLNFISTLDTTGAASVTPPTVVPPPKAHLVVDKVTNPSQDPQSFHFNATGSGYLAFDLTDQAPANDSGLLTPGTYSVSETPVSGWLQTSATCDNQQTPGNINLQPGQTVRCTFTNTKNPPRTMADLPALLNQLMASGDLHDALRTIRGRRVVVRPKTRLVQTLTRHGRAYELLDRRCASGGQTLISIGLDSNGIRPFGLFPLSCQQVKGQLVKLMYQVIRSNTPSLLTPAGAVELHKFLKEATGIDSP